MVLCVLFGWTIVQSSMFYGVIVIFAVNNVDVSRKMSLTVFHVDPSRYDQHEMRTLSRGCFPSSIN